MNNRDRIEELLKSYHQRNREIAARHFELARYTGLTETEYIAAANAARGDGAGHTPGHVSDKTLHIAFNYREQTRRLNEEAVAEISKELLDMELEQSRLVYYVSLLEERQSKALDLIYFKKAPLKEVAKEIGVAERTVQDVKNDALDVLAELYQAIVWRF